ncbi:cation:dicarboxylase symporter family transporter [Neoehrlichia mikurensis]|uniref:Dicarboxylate/amino acid:cation symporter n=1 Tax=Neoehrlichia mikurensis TaxID=89586 RepID=A0A9Q9F3C2_9RICK|nr:cation:dicarboxylase symporter family transporter [Neoehrlichia mikurensis]QXK92024.1 cation:dicarboxylase symporter family transporter [Neoehrlichia mikurensis]QXK92482.1 cation:dicarboxylase symporter family transporter [Neoehrlichia mikurensis]QXK93717.1 cation:dicarboxylase symporter family transporter [Neoehrlichia mikurensis]UTO55310.1 dicarboxylate/amino acid:cation symporter [Neoehrlichia mikurensis]UTO56230.1 dicarboxylate/amino acid:cation symporter [Neoehrlichia mikurensis]
MSYISMPLMLIVIITCSFAFADLIPYYIKSMAYSLSLSIKEVLIFTLPFIVFSLIFHAINQLQSSNAFKIMILLVVTITISNTVSVLIALFIGIKATAVFSQNNIIPHTINHGILEPLYKFHLPVIISNSHALILGICSGTILSKIKKDKAAKIAQMLSQISMFILKKIFIPIIPIFIIGFIFKMHDDKVLSYLSEHIIILSIIFACAYVYVIILYIVSNNFILHKAMLSIKNMFPAVILAFSTMSSLITMPITLSASQKNSNNEIANIVIPSATNIHLIGDCFFIVILSLLISSVFKVYPISNTDYLFFIIYFVISKFAVAALPGSGIIIMLPILKQYLHFSPTMISLITILYLIFDPIITSINVFGNGAFAILFFKIYKFLQKKGNLL